MHAGSASHSAILKFSEAAIWAAGFRPFFTLALVSGTFLPLIWAIAFSGRIEFPGSSLSAFQWHAHEMLFGFGWAVLGGFLLTASKNWVKIRGLHGVPLAIDVALWIMERFVILMPGNARPLWWLGVNGFLTYIAGYVMYSLICFRRQDSFRDNYFFLIILPLFVLAKNLILVPETYAHGVSAAIGLYRVAFLVMFERTMTQFMKNSMGIELFRSSFLDFSIKAFAVLAVPSSVLPEPFAIFLFSTLLILLVVRLSLWRPLAGFRFFGNAVMYLGYLGIVTHLLVEVLHRAHAFSGVGSLSVHVFTFLVMGLVIPAMLIRICQGHTGRPILFSASDRVALGLMGIGAFFRLIATQLWPELYTTWILLSGLGWSLCFATLSIRLIPFLWKPRIDGRAH